jgi:hypothetical protein
MVEIKSIDESYASVKWHKDPRKKQTTGLWPVAFSCGPQRILMRDDIFIVA